MMQKHHKQKKAKKPSTTLPTPSPTKSKKFHKITTPQSRRSYATVKPTHPNGVKPKKTVRRSLADLEELPMSQEPFAMDATTYQHRPKDEFKPDLASANSPFGDNCVKIPEQQLDQAHQQQHFTQSATKPHPKPPTIGHDALNISKSDSIITENSQEDQSGESAIKDEKSGENAENDPEPTLESILSSIKSTYPTQFYIEPPSSDVITMATNLTNEQGDKARKQVINFFRSSSRQSNLSKISAPVPYLLPIGESSPDTYPIPEFLLHTLYHLSGTTGSNYGFGMAAPQYGVNYRMFILRSEIFGVPSPITNIPYVLETNDDNHCMVSPRHIQRFFPKPTQFETIALSWDNPNPDFDSNTRPAVNTSLSIVDYHDMAGDNEFIQSRVRTDGQPGAVYYPLKKELTMPLKDAKQLNLCDDRILTTPFVPVSAAQPVRPQERILGRSKLSTSDPNRIIPANSFINDYRGYSVPLADIQREIFTPFFQAFQQNLPSTAIINPRVTAIRNEYFAMREGCFSFPHWHAFVSRPVACDVEFETLEIDGAPTPQSFSRKAVNSTMMSAALSQPAGSKLHYCPKATDSGLDQEFLTPNITKQLEISRIIPKPSQVKLVTRKLTLRDVASKVFLHEYDHLDGIQFFDRASGHQLSWQGFARQAKAEPHARFEYPVDIGGAYF